MEKKIKVVYVKPGEKAQVKEIDACLSSYQKAVSGFIEEYCPFEDYVAIVCNEEGKFNGMQPNRSVTDGDRMIDIIFGPFFIAALGEDDLESLADYQIERYLSMFLLPEIFLKNEKELIAVKYDPDTL